MPSLSLIILVTQTRKAHRKVKLKLSLCFKWAPRHVGVLRKWRYSATHSLTSALDGGEWSASRHGRFIPQGKSLWYPLNRRLGGSQSRSGRGGEEKNSQPRRESNPRIPIVQPVAQRYIDWAITALKAQRSPDKIHFCYRNSSFMQSTLRFCKTKWVVLTSCELQSTNITLQI
jgi:hypothetical protein